MPELPEVETVRRGLAPVMEGATIMAVDVRRPNLRFPFPEHFSAQLQNRTIVSLARRAKYLLIDLDDGSVVIMHLGMSGSFRTESGETPGNFHHSRNRNDAHDHVVFHLRTNDGASVKVIYNDPRRFGFMLTSNRSELEQHPLIEKLGVEPVGNSFDAESLTPKFAGKNVPLKSVLLDQSVIAGLGNIYVCEALWRTGLSPKRKARGLVLKSGKPSARFVELVGNIKDVIEEAIKAGGSSLRDHAQTDGTLGYFQHSFAVYDQEGEMCRKPDCSGTVKRITQSGRSTFYCSKCQH